MGLCACGRLCALHLQVAEQRCRRQALLMLPLCIATHIVDLTSFHASLCVLWPILQANKQASKQASKQAPPQPY